MTAWRQAVKATFTAGIQDKGVSAAVASLSVVCNDPAPESQSDLRRLIITVKLTPDLTLDELNLVSQTSTGGGVPACLPASEVRLTENRMLLPLPGLLRHTHGSVSVC